MRTPNAFFRFLLARLDRRRLDREMDEEMAYHIELHAESLERQGLSRSDAQRRARVEFGGVEQYREQARDARVLSWVHDLVADLRYGVRTLRRSPGFTLVTIASLAVGLGANIAIFGVVYGTMLQRLPIPHADELAALVVTVDGEPSTPFHRKDYLVLRSLPGISELESIREADDLPVEAGKVSGFAPIDYVDGGYLGLIGVRPVLGRIISPSDDQASSPVVVISDAVWSQFFARDSAAIGQRLLVKGLPFTVIGVMPAPFHGVLFNWRFGMAVPQSVAASLGVPASRDYVEIVTRLAPGGARNAVAARLDATLHACCLTAMKDPSKARLSLVDASRGIPYGKMDFRDDYRLLLWLLMGGAVLVLLIACSNVGSLMLARGAARERELAVRLSMGASRGRVVRQLLAESASLAAIGGGLGLVLAAWATGLLVASLPEVWSPRRHSSSFTRSLPSSRSQLPRRSRVSSRSVSVRRFARHETISSPR